MKKLTGFALHCFCNNCKNFSDKKQYLTQIEPTIKYIFVCSNCGHTTPLKQLNPSWAFTVRGEEPEKKPSKSVSDDNTTTKKRTRTRSKTTTKKTRKRTK